MYDPDDPIDPRIIKESIDAEALRRYRAISNSAWYVQPDHAPVRYEGPFAASWLARTNGTDTPTQYSTLSVLPTWLYWLIKTYWLSISDSHNIWLAGVAGRMYPDFQFNPQLEPKSYQLWLMRQPAKWHGRARRVQPIHVVYSGAYVAPSCPRTDNHTRMHIGRYESYTNHMRQYYHYDNHTRMHIERYESYTNHMPQYYHYDNHTRMHIERYESYICQVVEAVTPSNGVLDAISQIIEKFSNRPLIRRLTVVAMRTQSNSTEATLRMAMGGSHVRGRRQSPSGHNSRQQRNVQKRDTPPRHQRSNRRHFNKAYGRKR